MTRPTTPARGATAARTRTAPRRAAAPLDAACAEVLRTIANSRTPVFITVHANGRRRYGYWRPYDPRTGKGGCYMALPTAVCDRLESAGRITFGDPLVDPAKTTYRVWAADTPAEPAHAPARPTRTPAAAPVRLPAAPVTPAARATPRRAVAQRAAA
nr:hypothetical protein [Streptomyces ochraceiscleroticus]